MPMKHDSSEPAVLVRHQAQMEWLQNAIVPLTVLASHACSAAVLDLGFRISSTCLLLSQSPEFVVGFSETS